MFLEEGAVVSAYRSAFAAFDIPADDEDIAARRGASKRAVFEELATRWYPAGEIASVASQALAAFESQLRVEYTNGQVREVPGAAATVRHLREVGVRVALASGFDRALMDLLLERLAWHDLFDLTIAGNDVPRGRPSPAIIYHAMLNLGIDDVQQVAAVGDTPLDLQAGSNARAGWVIGVLSGAHGVATLGSTRHTHLLESVADLPTIFADGQSPSERFPREDTDPR